MKRMPDSKEWRFLPVRMYLCDVEKIVDAVWAQYPDARIEVGKYAVAKREDLDEVAREIQEATELSIWASEPGGCSIHLLMTPGVYGRLNVSDDGDARAMGVAGKIAIVVKKREIWRTVAWICGCAVVYIIGLLAGLRILLAGIDSGMAYGVIGGVAILACGVLAGWLGWVLAFRRYCVIRMCRAREHVGFFAKNRDELIRSVIIAVLSALLAIAGTLLVRGAKEGPQGDVREQNKGGAPTVGKEAK